MGSFPKRYSDPLFLDQTEARRVEQGYSKKFCAGAARLVSFRGLIQNLR